jgi:hypothetical protein
LRTNLAFVFAFATIVVINVLVGRITTGTGNIIGYIPAVTAAYRFYGLFISPKVIS